MGPTLADNSYGAPFLMQELCFQYVTTELRLLQTAEEPLIAPPPDDWEAFFSAIANRYPPAGQQIGGSLGHMSTLADLNRGTGDAAIV